MKKIIASVLAIMVGISSLITAMGASSTVKISSGDAKLKDIAYSYDPETPATSAKSIKKLMTGLNSLSSKGKIVQNLKITSESVINTPVKFSLRLENTKVSSTAQPAKATPSPDEGSVFDYYNIVVRTKDGDVVYDYEKADETLSNAKYKDIPLLTLNNSKSIETAEYEITVSANKDLADKSREASRLDWEIMVDAYSLKNTPSATPELTSPEPISQLSDDDHTAAPTVAPATEPEEAKAFSVSDGTYIVGKDIIKGRYEITGDAVVKVYTKEGDLKTNIHLTTEKDSKTGVNSYVLTLNTDDETVEVEGTAAFEPYSPIKVTAAPSTAGTTSANASATTKPSATIKPSATSKPNSTSNPKTGDNAPIAVTAIAGLAAFFVIVVIEYRKKKQN